MFMEITFYTFNLKTNIYWRG